MALCVTVLASVKMFGEPDTKASAVHSEDDEFFLTWLENIQAKHDVGHATPAKVYRAALADCAKSADITVAGPDHAWQMSAVRGANKCREELIAQGISRTGRRNSTKRVTVGTMKPP
jgi:hypothetical protein